MSQTYAIRYAEQIARGMLQRYGGTKQAVEECQRHASSPLTTDEGRAFWQLVLGHIQQIGNLTQKEGQQHETDSATAARD